MEYAGKECLFISLFQRIIEVYMKSGCLGEVCGFGKEVKMRPAPLAIAAYLHEQREGGNRVGGKH